MNDEYKKAWSEGEPAQAVAPAAEKPVNTETAEYLAAHRAMDEAPKFSAAQEKWLGNADRTDPYILMRMRKAVPDEKAPVEERVATPVPKAAAPAADLADVKRPDMEMKSSAPTASSKVKPGESAMDADAAAAPIGAAVIAAPTATPATKPAAKPSAPTAVAKAYAYPSRAKDVPMKAGTYQRPTSSAPGSMNKYVPRDAAEQVRLALIEKEKGATRGRPAMAPVSMSKAQPLKDGGEVTMDDLEDEDQGPAESAVQAARRKAEMESDQEFIRAFEGLDDDEDDEDKKDEAEA